MSKSFRSGSKNRSSSSNFISLHFNKADEDQLEISYVEREEEDGKKEGSPNSDNSSVNSAETGESFPKVESDIDAANAITQKNSSTSKEPLPAKDSVKDYLSRISKRRSTSDALLEVPDTESLEPKEGWMLWKDLREKFAKTIEEHKNVSKGSKDEKASEGSQVLKKSWTDPGEFDPDRTPTDSVESEILLKLSPAIEADEMESKSLPYESYINSELSKAKCEIISTKPSKSSSAPQFYLHQPKIPTKLPDVEETQSNGDSQGRNTLEENRQTVPSTSSPSSSLDQPDNVQKGLFHKLPLLCKKYYYFVKLYWNRVIFRILVAVLALLFVPVPSWISGFVAGAFLSGYIMYSLLKPAKPKEAFVVPDFNSMPPSNIPVQEVEEEPIIHKGWMNELPFELNYNPETYHVNCTRSMYVRLDGSYLRVSYPQNNIPKRAMFNETRHDLQFIHQQHYDITGSSVELLPVGLARKRLWSKKYPICLRIPNPKQAVLSKSAKDTPESTLAPKPPSRKESPIRRFNPRINENNEVVLYLFSRTDRDKDLWYNRFRKASRLKLLRSHSPSSSPNIAALDSSGLENRRATSIDLTTLQYFSNHDENDSLDFDDDVDSYVDLSMTKQQKFEMYMKQLLAPLHSDPFLFSVSKEKKEEKSGGAQKSLMWLNVLLGRVFFDFLTEDVWTQLVSEKIQRKLSKIKLPVFLKELIVKDINLGTALPKIHRASEPFIDQKGLWIDIDLSYNGSFHMTLETKINLLRAKCDPEEFSLPSVSKSSDNIDQVLRSPVYNSDEEDSAESSSDEDIPLPEVHDATDDSSLQLAGGSTGKKILRLVDRFAQSTYFQNAAKNKYIKKAMEDISNTPLILTVEVQWLTGTLALNIPPMPTDRLWYGFRTNPHLSIVARPKLGHHVVTLTHVTEWIERKLVSEFQKILVMPNMDDLIIPIMLSDTDFPKT